MTSRRPWTPARIVVVLLLVTLVHRSIYAACTFALHYDSGTVARMGLHILEGARPLFLYGFNYSASLLAYLVAGSFWCFGPSIPALVVAPILLTMAWVVLVYLLFKELINERAGLVAALCSVFPDWITSYHTMAPDTSYSPQFVLGTAVLWLCVRITLRNLTGRPLWYHALALGLGAGLALWVHALSVVYLLPGLCFLIYFFWRQKCALRVLAPFAVGSLFFLLGISPYLLIPSSGSGGELAAWHADAATIWSHARVLLLETWPGMVNWPVGRSHLPESVFPPALALLLLLYGWALCFPSRGIHRVRLLLPLVSSVFFLALFLPHEMADDSAYRYFIGAWSLALAGMLAAICTASRPPLRLAGTAFLGCVLLYNTLGWATTSAHMRPIAKQTLEELHRRVVEAENSGAECVMLVGDYAFGATGQSLGFLSRDRVLFVADTYERDPLAGQRSDHLLDVAWAAPLDRLGILTNSLHAVRASYQLLTNGTAAFACNLERPSGRQRSVPPWEFELTLEGASGGQPASLVDRHRYTSVRGRFEDRTSLTVDFGRPRLIEGVRLLPLRKDELWMPTSFLVEGAQDGSSFETLTRVDQVRPLTYVAGPRIYMENGYGSQDIRFPPTEVRRLRVTPLGGDEDGTWYASELFVFEPLDAPPVDWEKEAEALSRHLDQHGISFTVGDRWLSAGRFQDTLAPGTSPAFARLHRHLEVVVERPRYADRSFIPRPGLALVVSGAMALETEQVLRAAYGPSVTWERKDFDHYVCWIFTSGPSEGTPPGTWWSGVVPLRL